MQGVNVGQSLMEYVLLFAIVAAAFAAMYPFAMRAVNGRLSLLEELADTSANEVLNNEMMINSE